MMSEPLNKSQLLEKIRASRAAWEAALAGLAEDQMLQPSVAGNWSVKDLIAHISWFEREMIHLLETRVLAGSELWLLPTDERNAAIFAANKDRSLQEVREEAQALFARLLAAVEKLDEPDLHDPSRFSQMPPDWQPWRLLAENTYEHYEDHLREVQSWLNSAQA